MLPPPLPSPPSLCRPDEPIDKGLWLYARRPFGNKVNACTSSMEASGCRETIAFINAARCHLIRLRSTSRRRPEIMLTKLRSDYPAALKKLSRAACWFSRRSSQSVGGRR